MKSSFLETIKVVDGEVFNILYHQKRYESVLNSFGVHVYQDLSSFIKPPKDGIYRCRLVYSPTDLHVDISYHKYNKRDIKSLKLVYDDTIDYSFKSTCRDELNKLFALKENCDDILIVKNSLITDTSIANIAIFKNNMWLTPKTPLLKGTTRQRLLDEGQIVEVDIHVDDLKTVSKVVLLNAMIDFDIIQDISFKQ